MRLLTFQYPNGTKAHLFTQQPLDYRELVKKFPEIKGCTYANEYFVDCMEHEVVMDHLFIIKPGDKLQSLKLQDDKSGKSKKVARNIQG